MILFLLAGRFRRNGCLTRDWFAFPSVHVAITRAAVSADVRPALGTNGIKDMLIAAQSDILPPKPNSNALSRPFKWQWSRASIIYVILHKQESM